VSAGRRIGVRALPRVWHGRVAFPRDRRRTSTKREQRGAWDKGPRSVIQQREVSNLATPVARERIHADTPIRRYVSPTPTRRYADPPIRFS